jgi:hypothetical protein
MRLLLCLLSVLSGCSAYYFYGQDQFEITGKNMAEQTAADALSTQADALNGQITTLQAQLSNAERGLALSGGATPSTLAGRSAAGRPDSIPGTLTTLSGHSYTGCQFTQAWPDGISFTHSLGTARVAFTDLDPTFAQYFHYDPMASQSYVATQESHDAASDTAADAVRLKAQTASDAVASQMAIATSTSSPVTTSTGSTQMGQALTEWPSHRVRDDHDSSTYGGGGFDYYTGGHLEHRYSKDGAFEQMMHQDRQSFNSVHANAEQKPPSPPPVRNSETVSPNKIPTP